MQPLKRVQWLVLALAFIVGAFIETHLFEAHGQETTKKPDYVIASTSLTTALTMTQYGRISVSDWFTLSGKEPSGKQSVTVWDAETFSHEHVKIEVKHEPVVTKRSDGTWEITFNPPPPKTPAVKTPEKNFVDLLATTTERIRSLRVREYRGALFEALAVDYIRGERINLAGQVRAAREAAKQIADKEDEFTRASVLEAAEEFAAVVENAQPRVQR